MVSAVEDTERGAGPATTDGATAAFAGLAGGSGRWVRGRELTCRCMVSLDTWDHAELRGPF